MFTFDVNMMKIWWYRLQTGRIYIKNVIIILNAMLLGIWWYIYTVEIY